MRTTIQTQMPIVNPYIDHDHAQELEAISEILDTEPAIVGLVYDDLIRGGIEADNGREGMTAEQVLRALIVKQMNEFSYEELRELSEYLLYHLIQPLWDKTRETP